ncbi:MAG: serine/threonine protein kinase [Oscillospiraceae bacterium]
MIHRDIAPDNIMLLKDGGVRLIDFGAARHAVHDCGKSMTVIIKDGYSPEEQYNSHSVQGPAADVYALSATLYQMITGITPPGAIERGEYLQKHKRDDSLPPPSKFNKAVTKTQDTAILNGMALHTQDRTQSVAELYEELTAQTPVRRVQETIRQRQLQLAAWAKITAGVLAAAIVAGGVLPLSQPQAEDRHSSERDGSYVLSPNVAVNMRVVNAVTAAEDASLHFGRGGSDCPTRGVERGRILTQNPDPGTKLVPASRNLLATASLGK